MVCDMCGREAEIEEAVEQGWWPTYWADGKQQPNPVCWECAAKFLRLADDCEMELDHGHTA